MVSDCSHRSCSVIVLVVPKDAIELKVKMFMNEADLIVISSCCSVYVSKTLCFDLHHKHSTVLLQYCITVWAENLAGIKFGGLALKGCELHLAD